MDHACRAIPESKVDLSYFYDLPIKSSLLQWDREVLPGPEDREVLPGPEDPEEFHCCAERMLSEALARDEDPLLDKAYPEFIQCMVKCMRISRNTWGEHDAWLEEQGAVCTTPGCQCRARGRTMFPIFAKGMETDDSKLEEIADWNEQPCGMGSSDSDSEDVVRRTYTPPLQRKRGRKYASLRKHETDVEDYFSDSSAEEDWIDESRYWWNRC